MVPTLLYLLAVVAASAFGRWWSGPVAGFLSFLGLNLLFTPPIHTLRVDKVEDLIALVVFLVVSLIVGTLLSRSLAERERVERREREAESLHRLTLALRSGEPVDESMRTYALDLVRLFALQTCVMRSDAPAASFEVAAPKGAGVASPGSPRLEVELPIRGGGSVVVSREPGGPQFSREERETLSGMADQVASALEGARLDAEVRSARLEAEVNEARAALFSSVTHDLRTPLASIKTAISSLLQPDVEFTEEERRDLLQTVQEETDRLNRLVGNLMDLSRDRAGVLSPARARTSMEEVIDSVVARMRSQLSRVRVQTMIRPDLPDAWVDPIQMDQVLTNLLENAVRFAPPSSEIGIHAARFGDLVQVRVVDHGPGIARGERDHVFEAFHTGDRPGSGSGLGLAISRAIVESHGGRIWAEETPGGGATMVFEIPITEAA